MSIIGSNILAGASGQAGEAAYQIEQSLRFDGAAYFGRTPSSSGNRRTFTWSGWVKRSYVGGAGRNLWSGYPDSVSNADQFRFGDLSGTDGLGFFTSDAGTGNVQTSALYRDPSAWMHIVLAVDTTQSTAANRVKFFVNGSQVTDFAVSSYPAQNLQSLYNSTTFQTIGANARANVDFFDGYMAEVHVLDGTAVTDALDFGEYDNNGIWRPIEYTGGNYGTNGFYLKFDPSATNGIGHDHSGNGNNWTANNFTTSGTGTDVMSDTPTTNWCTLNPLEKPANGTLSNGNLELSASSDLLYRLATIQIPSSSTKKFYWEVKYEGGPNYGIGIKRHLPGGTEYGDTIRLQETNGGDAGISGAGVFSSFTTDTAPSTTTAEGDVIGVAYDPSAGTIDWTKNGSTFGEASGLASADVVPFFGRASSTGSQTSKFIVNFGQRDFEYTPPTGYVALNTSNLPAPGIKDGSDYFNTVLWTGNGTSGRQITGVGFQPDFVWLKNRSDTWNNSLSDAVRGANKQLISNDKDSEYTNTAWGYTSSFDTDGFTATAGSSGISNINDSGDLYVAWNWLAGSGTSSNTNGSITTTVSANPTAGFSIVSYTGNGTNGATIGHGLGVAPKMVIWKNRDDGGTNDHWLVYNEEIGLANNQYLNLAQANTAASIFWDTAPSSTVFTMKNENKLNASGDDYIAYFFAEVEGYSRFGSYTGNGSSTDGPFVYTGFAVSWVMCKRTDSATASNWVMWDNKRNPYNESANYLLANTNAAEGSSGTQIDLLSNGFKPRSVGGCNTSGASYIFMALAENPFGGSGVSPATAR